MKAFRSHAELVKILAARGMDVSDPQRAETLLRRHGYHRLGGYRYPFREFLPEVERDPTSMTFRRDTYVPGSTLDDVVALAEFDAKLRRVCLEGVLEFEVRVRSALGHQLAARSPVAHVSRVHLDRAVCDQVTNARASKLAAWLDTVDTAENRAGDDDFVVHHRQRYPREPIPVWALVELLDFGSLPYLLDLMLTEDRNAVARAFGVRQGATFARWVRALADLRNVSAHNQRLFNRSMKRGIAPRSGSGTSELLEHLYGAQQADQRRFYRLAAVLAYMLVSHESGSNWNMTLKSQVRKLPVIQIGPEARPLLSPESSMGFPGGWEELELWARKF